MTRLKDKVTLVTEAASGMGRSHAELFAREGAAVVVTDMDSDGLAETARLVRAAGGQVLSVRLDVSQELAWDEVMHQTEQAFGGVDVLVNNAGTYVFAPTEENTVANWDRVMAINARGAMLGCRTVIASMRKRGGGSIINVSSSFGLVGRPGFSAYCASKGSVRLMTNLTVS